MGLNKTVHILPLPHSRKPLHGVFREHAEVFIGEHLSESVAEQ